MPTPKRLHHPLVPYAITLGGVALMFCLRLMLAPVLQERQPYIFSYFVVALAAWGFGWRPATFAAVVSGVLVFWAFVPPPYSFRVTHVGDKAGLFVYSLLAGGLIVLIEKALRAAARAEAAAEQAKKSEQELQRTLLALEKRDSQLRLVLEAAQFGTCEWNLTDNSLLWSKEHFEILGYEAFSFQPRLEHFIDRIHPDDRAAVEREFDVAQKERRLVRSEFRVVLPNDETRWMQAMGRYTFDADTPTSLSGLLLDVTARRQHDESLRESRAQLQLVADSIPVAVCHCDAQQRFRFVNEIYARQRGVRAENCIGKYIWEVVGREAYDSFSRYIDIVLSGQPIEFEIAIPYKVGRRFMHCAYVPEFDAAKHVEGFVCAISDVTERRVAEIAAHENEARLRTAMDAGRLGAWEWDIVSNRVTWSERIYAFHGLTPGEFDGTSDGFAKLVHPEDWPRVQAAIRSALENRSNYEIEFRTVLPDGSVRWLATSARVIFDENGKPLRMLGGTIDLTERKKMELELRAAQTQLAQHTEELEQTVRQRTAELERSLQSVESLCYTIAHDLRAPLRAMQGFARALADDCREELSPTAATYTQRITRAATRMDGLITDLLAYGRLGMTDITALPVELDTALDAFLTDYAEEVKSRHATICIERLLPMVIANRTLLAQVIANLLLNAMKFVAPGKVPQIRVYAEVRGDRVRLNIEDNGIGIAEEHRAKLFQVFQRLHGPEHYPGSGIGLAIVKKAVERMGGSVGFTSVVGKGSTFWIELPGGSASKSVETAASAITAPR